LASPSAWKSLVIELALRDPKQGDEEANDCFEQSRPAPQFLDFGDELSPLATREITGNDFSRATLNPASKG